METTIIIKNYDEVFPYKSEIISLSDRYKNELGFIPYSGYDEYFSKENIFAATIVEENGKSVFCGYAMLGGKYPTKKIFQLAVVPQYHRRKVGETLVNAVIEDARENGYCEIKIRVKADMMANMFWGKQSFRIVSNVHNAQSRSEIFIRVREITPTLFSQSWAHAGLQAAANKISSFPKLYLLDTNIILDLSTDREDAIPSRNLLSLINKRDIDVAVAESCVKELRTNSTGKKDGAIRIINGLRQLSLTDESELRKRVSDALFPDKRNIRGRDASDIEQVATAVAHHASGFITRDNQILRKRRSLMDEFSLEILSPDDFLEGDELEEIRSFNVDNISTNEELKITSGLNSIEARNKIADVLSHRLDENRFTYGTFEVNGRLVANCALEKRSPPSGKARMAILFIWSSEDKQYISNMVDYLDSQIASYQKFGSIALSIHGWSEHLMNVLQDRGYFRSDSGNYTKLYVGPIISGENWQKKKSEVQILSGMSLPCQAPNYESYNQIIDLGQDHSTLHVLENFLSAIFVLPDRDGAIIPIKKNYADAFFGHSRELPLIPPPEARLSAHKSYFGTRNAASRLRAGNLLFFYQSGDRHNRGQVIAFARILRTYIVRKERVDQETVRRGVLETDELRDLGNDPALLETVFTHSVVMPNPITLQKLREINCYDSANFVSAYAINHQQVCDLLREGGIV